MVSSVTLSLNIICINKTYVPLQKNIDNLITKYEYRVAYFVFYVFNLPIFIKYLFVQVLNTNFSDELHSLNLKDKQQKGNFVACMKKLRRHNSFYL